LVAEIHDEVVGVIGMRDWNHIFLLFVDGGHQHKGIARKLVSKALGRGEIEGHHSEKVTVNSSPNAVGAYRRMGFVQTADEEIHNGIRAIPMMLDTTDWDAG
jgi:GNAT superfamily N-acetyltransferase